MDKTDKLKDIAICVDCQNGELLLGKSTQVEIDSIFYTISPDPELNDFQNKIPNSQKKWIDNKFQIAYNQVQKYLPTLGYTIHYEFNKSLNLHIHGLIYIDKQYSNYDKNLAVLSKTFHKHFGRQYTKSIIDSRFEWINDKIQVYKYVNKSNEYEPIHKQNKEPKDITNYLTKGDKAPLAPMPEASNKTEVETETESEGE